MASVLSSIEISQSKVAAQNSCTELFSENFSLDVILQIFNELDARSVTSISLASRSLRDLTQMPKIWDFLLRRDFGDEAANKLIDQSKCNEVYVEKFKEANEFLKSLPNSHLLLVGAKEPSSIIYGSYVTSDLNKYIDSLSLEDLCIVFCKSAEFGFAPMISAIISHRRFPEIPANEAKGLCFALGSAARYNRMEVVKILLSCPRFNEINISGEMGLNWVLNYASSSHSLEILECLFQNERFALIPLNGVYGFGMVLTFCCVNNNVNWLDFLMRSKIFEHIDLDYVRGAFVTASITGSESAMEFFMKHGRFDQEMPLWLSYAFVEGAKYGQIGSLQFLMKSSRRDEVAFEAVIKALYYVPFYFKLTLMHELIKRADFV